MKELSKNRFKLLQKLHQKKYRDGENIFIISGLRAVRSALENKNSRFTECIFCEDKVALIEDAFKNTGHIVPQFSLPVKEFAKLVDEKTPQGICLIAKKPSTQFSIDNISGDSILFLDRVSDPGNLGTIIRGAEWFGFNTILLSSNSADPFQPKVARSSAGTLLNISIFDNVSANHLEDLKKELGFKIYATDISDGQDIAHFKFAKKSIIMMGSEAHGLNPDFAAICDDKISIKRRGSGESLNLANAASIIMYQIKNN